MHVDNIKKGNELEKEKQLVSKSTITYLKNTKGLTLKNCINSVFLPLTLLS